MDRREDVRIESLAYTGAGIARLATGKVVFVEDAVVGDHVRVRIQDDRERFSNASIETLLEPSPERVEPPCPYHGTCGGCGLQHMSYREQLRWKRHFVIDALERIGSVGDAETLVADTVAGSAAWGYRNKIELEPLRQNNRLSLGLHAKNSNEVIPIERCLLLPEGLAGLPARLAGALGFALKPSDAPLKRVSVRVSSRTGDVEPALWTEPGPCNRSFVAGVLKDAVKNSSLVRVLVAGDVKKRDVKKVEVLAGRGHWREDLGGFRYRVSAPSFFQVNTPVAQLLVNRVLMDMEPDGARAADLYSGVGTFTLPLARRAKDLCAVEVAGSGIRDLRRNLDTYGLEAQIASGDVARALPELGRFDSVVVDPPRGGLGPSVLRAVVEASPRTLVYVSCDPATLARDVKGLVEQGYRPVSAVPFDLFPQTWHVETVMKLIR
jgi:23S rRNA (uracil1939-C5)-methyltransferase